jgi:aminopeptidase YwaD
LYEGWTELLDEYLKQIAQTNVGARRDAILSILDSIGAPYLIETPFLKNKQKPINITVPLHMGQMPYILIASNYDSPRGSQGANSNAAAIALALGLLRVFRFLQKQRKRPLPLEFAFFDFKERGQIGSRAYAERVDTKQIYAMLNLNLCGRGNTVLMARGQHVGEGSVERSLRQLQDSPHQPSLRFVDMLPSGDAESFEPYGVPIVSICVVPKEDILPMIGLAVALHNQETVAVLPSVYEAIHNRGLDTVDNIELDAMRQVMLVVNTLISNLLKIMPEEDINWKKRRLSTTKQEADV